MMLPDSLRVGVTEMLQQKISDPISITKYTPASGGCINNGGTITTTGGRFFIKWNDAFRFPGMFDAEAKGLMKLAEANAIDVPKALATGMCGEFQFIIMENVDQQPRSSRYWETFGEQLANLHRVTSPAFGLDHDNYIGSLPQSNTLHQSWTDFFINARLRPQIDLAIRSGRIGTSLAKYFEKLFNVLPGLIIEEKPSLLHGDLWSGNLITNNDGVPCLIDPAVYYGNREADLAMTQLFGGFNSAFLETYHSTFPLLPGFNERIDLYNLYPLLVHVNLFGESYGSQVQSVVKRFVR